MRKENIKNELSEIQHEIWELESDRNNVGNEFVIRYIESRGCALQYKMNKLKLELEKLN